MRTADAADLAEAVEGAMAVTATVLQDFVEARVRVAAGRSEVAARLWTDLAGVIGGKLMRPRLAVAAYLGLGGTDRAAIAPVAAAIEVLHTAMLVHDDLLDHDEVRRGRPNVAGAARAGSRAAAWTTGRSTTRCSPPGCWRGTWRSPRRSRWW